MPAATPHSDSAIAETPLAPRWHTALLVSLMLTVPILGSILAARGALVTAPPQNTRISFAYLPTFVVEWSMAIYVFRIGRPKSALSALIGKKWINPSRIAIDLVFAALLFVFIEGAEAGYAHFSGEIASAATLAILPTNVTEKIAWCVLATSVGFCEEVIYRGYLNAQLAAFSRSVAIGVIAQAFLFGLAHGEQGWSTAPRFAIYGVAFGVVAVRRKSLLPGIVAHIAVDVSSGLLHH